METPDRESETQTEMTTNPSKKQNYCFPPPFFAFFLLQAGNICPSSTLLKPRFSSILYLSFYPGSCQRRDNYNDGDFFLSRLQSVVNFVHDVEDMRENDR